MTSRTSAAEETRVADVPKSGLMARAEPSSSITTVDRTGVSIAQLLELAVNKGLPAAELKELLTLHERMADRSARQEFAHALAAFKAECPPIFKTKKVQIAGRSGSYGYSYAPLEEIMPVIEPYLTKHGFTVKWDRTADKGLLTSVCTLRHIAGHSDTSSFTLPTESANPGMSIQQKYGGAATFADRKALQAVLGIVAGDEDQAATREADPTTVSDAERAEIDRLLAARNEGKTEDKAERFRARFLKHLGVETVDTILASDYQAAIALLQPPATSEAKS